MLTNRSKPFVVGCLVLGLLFCSTGVATVGWYKRSNECFENRSPLTGFVVIIDEGQQKLLIEKSQKFAGRYGFKFDIVYYTPQSTHFLIDITRKDVEVIISNTSFDLGKFYVYFYNYDCIHPTVASDIGDLVDDLKTLVNEIPDAKITEDK